jgi:tyrosine-protein kinase
MDLMRTLAIVRRWLPLLIASMVLAAGAAYAISNIQQKTYQAQATLIVGQSLTSSSPDYTQLLTSQELATTYASVATKRPILEGVISQLGLDMTPDDLLRQVSADALPGSTLLTISATDSDPGQAAAIANAAADGLVAASSAIQGRQEDIQKSIDADLAATQEQIVTTQGRITELSNQAQLTPEEETELGTLQSRLVTLRSTYATLLGFSSANATNLITIVEPAAARSEPISPRPLLNTLVAAILGLLVAVGAVFVVEYLNDALRNAEEVEEATGLSTLGSISRMRSADGRREMYQLSALLYPRSPVTEAYRTLRTNLEFASIDKPIRSLLVASSRSGEGKTVTSANLALVFAQAGKRVLLVDADLRKPGVHAVFNLTNTDGLTTLLRGDDIQLDQIAQATEQENLRVLTTGPLPPNPAELLSSMRMRAILEHAESMFDLVILDSPPLQVFADSSILGSLADGTLVVIDAGRSRRRSVRLSREALARAGAHVLGAVLNRAPQQAATGYGYEYGDYFSADARSVTGGTEEAPGRLPT